MIKLKNLWKIALATMAMSAMLVACDTSSDSGNKSEEESLGGVGVYSYTVNIADISGAWGGNSVSPAFSVVLLNETTLAACSAAGDFKQATAAEPEYQIGAFGNMKIKDTASAGNFAVYGQSAVDDVFQYYNGIAATVTADAVTLYVDMTKLVKTDLKGLWKDTGNGDEAVMTADDLVDLAGYKPYVIALGTEAIDPDNKAFAAWSADVMKMEENATFPAGDLKKDAPVVPSTASINCIVGSINSWAHTPMTDNTATFVAAGGDQFSFTNGGWDYRFADAVVTALDTEVELKEYSAGDPPHVTFADGVLTAGTEYTVTFIAVDKHTAKVKVSAK
jgi:hypothetical protein